MGISLIRFECPLSVASAIAIILLAVTSLDKVDIAAFVDSNPKYQGQQLHGSPILGPESLAGRTEPILISSYAAQHEIAQQIRQKLRLVNELILLYDSPK